MKKTSKNRYQPNEFARKSGVTVRTLHHYDRIGLLKPSDHTGAGFRLYRDDDFVRLQQIVTLKFIGFSLKEIKRLMDRKGSGLAAALQTQRKTLEEKRRQLDLAVQAIARAEHTAGRDTKPDWEAFQKVVEVIQMQTNTDWTKQYYNEEAQKLIAERSKLWNPELQKKAEADWTALYRDIEAAASRGIAPDSEEAQALVERHSALVGGFTGGNPAIAEGLKKMWSDQANWPEEFKKGMIQTFAQHDVPATKGPAPSLMSAGAEAFFKKVMKAGEQLGAKS